MTILFKPVLCDTAFGQKSDSAEEHLKITLYPLNETITTGWKELNNENMHKTCFVFKMMLLNSYLFTDIVSFRMLGLVKACIHASLFTDWEKKMSFPAFQLPVS